MRICLVLLKVRMKVKINLIVSLSFLLTSFDIRQCNFSMRFELAKTVLKLGSDYILMVWKMYLTQQVLRNAKNIEETLRKKQ
ncbi:unnamed protein product [Brassica rapa subsp. trilocularis]